MLSTDDEAKIDVPQYHTTLPFKITHWPLRNLWVEISEGVSFIQNLLFDHLGINDLSNIVASYAYFNPNVYKLTVKQNQETDEMHRTLEQNHNVGEANNNPSTR